MGRGLFLGGVLKLLDVRGRFKAHYAAFAEAGYYHSRTGPATYPTEETVATSGVFGGKVIDLTHNAVSSGVSWPGKSNWPSTVDLSFRIRFVPNWTGNPSIPQVLIHAKTGDSFNVSGGYFYINTDGKIGVLISSDTFATAISGNLTLSTPLSITAGVATEIMATYTGSTGALKISQDGVEVYSGAGSTISNRDNECIQSVGVGFIAGSISGVNYELNQLEVWDTIENHVYTARTDFDGTAINQPLTNVFPLESEIESGVEYTKAGIAETGTLVVDYTIPEVDEVKHGVEFGPSSSLETGTYRGLDLWDSVDLEDLKEGVEILQNGETLTGELKVYFSVWTLREKINAVLDFIGETSLTDIEFSALEIDSFGYDIETYEAIDAVLDSRSSISTSFDRLQKYFESTGLEISEPAHPKSNVLFGLEIEE